jgi:hypothetical protein
VGSWTWNADERHQRSRGHRSIQINTCTSDQHVHLRVWSLNHCSLRIHSPALLSSGSANSDFFCHYLRPTRRSNAKWVQLHSSLWPQITFTVLFSLTRQFSIPTLFCRRQAAPRKFFIVRAFYNVDFNPQAGALSSPTPEVLLAFKR